MKSNPYKPKSPAYDLYEKAKEMSKAPTPNDEVAQQIDINTIAVYEVGAALVNALSNMTKPTDKDSN